MVGAAAGAGSVVTFAYAPSSAFPFCAAGAYGLGVALNHFFDRKGNSLASGLLTAALLTGGYVVGRTQSDITKVMQQEQGIAIKQTDGRTTSFQKQENGTYAPLEKRLDK